MKSNKTLTKSQSFTPTSTAIYVPAHSMCVWLFTTDTISPGNRSSPAWHGSMMPARHNFTWMDIHMGTFAQQQTGIRNHLGQSWSNPLLSVDLRSRTDCLRSTNSQASPRRARCVWLLMQSPVLLGLRFPYFLSFHVS